MNTTKLIEEIKGLNKVDSVIIIDDEYIRIFLKEILDKHEFATLLQIEIDNSHSEYINKWITSDELNFFDINIKHLSMNKDDLFVFKNLLE